MANHKPIKIDQNELQRFQEGDTVGIEHGGTGASTSAGARSALGLEIGSDVQAYSAQLDAIGGWSAAGILVGDGTGGFLPREVATASPTRVTITNGDGVDGNIVIDLATVGSAIGSGFYKFARDDYGRVTSTAPVVASDITDLIDGVYAALSGASFSGFVSLHADPTNPMHAATKQYVDNLFSSGGIPPFLAVVAKTTEDIDISAPGASHDNVTLVAGDRLLVGSQTSAEQNGIYVYNGPTTPLTRAEDADESSEFVPARQVFVRQGTNYSNTGWAVGVTEAPVLGTDPITFTQVSGAASYSAGDGLSLDGNQFSAVGVSGEITVSASGIGLTNSGVTAGTYTKVTVDSKGRVTAGGSTTPTDIGAQPASDTLTALATFSSNGFIVRTGNDAFAGRTIAGTTGQINVTDGSGAGGNPTISLEDTGVTPGTYNSVTVDAKGRVTAGSTSATNSVVEEMVNGTATAVSMGRAVYISGDDQISLAIANNIASSKVVGFVGASSIAAGAAGPIIIDGIVEATTGEWDAVTGQSSGLTPGAEYYLSNINAGTITTSAPTTGVHVPVGVALSRTKLKIDVKRVVIL